MVKLGGKFPVSMAGIFFHHNMSSTPGLKVEHFYWVT